MLKEKSSEPVGSTPPAQEAEVASVQSPESNQSPETQIASSNTGNKTPEVSRLAQVRAGLKRFIGRK